MALVVEDGTGLANADSLVSVSQIDAYSAAHYESTHVLSIAWAALISGNKDIKARQGYAWMEEHLGRSWRGVRASDTQALDWPRADVEDIDGNALDNDEIPNAVQNLQCEMSMRAAYEDIRPDLDEDAAKTQEAVSVGSLSVSTSYMGGATGEKDYVFARRMVARYLQPGDRLIRG